MFTSTPIPNMFRMLSIRTGYSDGSKRFQKVKNDDLWRRFIPLMRMHKLQFHWIKGHAGHPENERCDQLAVKAAQSQQLSIDVVFEQLQNS